MNLRPYQQEAVDAVLSYIALTPKSPCLVEAPTGAGKSHIIASIASNITKMMPDMRVLCLAPSRELVIQNRKKYLLSGNSASLFSASAGQISLRHQVIFGTPKTVINRIGKFLGMFSCVIVDEAHGVTPTIKNIISALRGSFEGLIVIGLSATPYRMNTGYIYQWNEHNDIVPENKATDPYFDSKVYTIEAQELIAQGFLCPAVTGITGSWHYDTEGMQLSKMGTYAKKDCDRAYLGHERKTSKIIQDIVEQSADRKGVLLFASTIKHAEECLASLPPELSAIVTGTMAKKERDRILNLFLKQELKYLVNVSVLTVGFDAPHVDVIALLRLTESVGLLTQMIGRGLRICENKTDCLVLDYAENIARHCPDGDIFDPKIKANVKFPDDDKQVIVEAVCETCNKVNSFKVRNGIGLQDIDKNGYLIDLSKNRILTDFGAMPGHYGRRCKAGKPDKATGKIIRCSGRWTFKTCPECGEENDISSRQCTSCRHELVDPNKKLKLKAAAINELRKQKKYEPKTEKVLSWSHVKTVSKKGNDCTIINWVTTDNKFRTWNLIRHKSSWNKLITETHNLMVKPDFITYRKSKESGYYTIMDFNPLNTEKRQDI